jgi:hypothetical protein
MSAEHPEPIALLEKLRELAPDRLAEVEDFVDFLRQKDEERRLLRSVTALSEASFAQVWDNPHDAAYDQL